MKIFSGDKCVEERDEEAVAEVLDLGGWDRRYIREDKLRLSAERNREGGQEGKHLSKGISDISSHRNASLSQEHTERLYTAPNRTRYDSFEQRLY